MKVTIHSIMGYKDFFPIDTQLTREEYCRKISRKEIEELVSKFLGPLGKEEFKKGPNHTKEEYHSFFPVESLLNLLMFSQTINVNGGESKKDSKSIFIKLLLLFNDDLKNKYDKAANSVRGFTGVKRVMSQILATSFPQADFYNIDYCKLFISQTHKSLKLMNFLANGNKFYKEIYRRLLRDFECDTGKELLGFIIPLFFKKIRGEKNKTGGIEFSQGICLVDNPQKKKIQRILNSLTLTREELSSVDQNDYLALRNKPFIQYEENQYLSIFDLFLIKKIYNGLIFKLSSYDKTFLGEIRKDFSEEVLLYETLEIIDHPDGSVLIRGENFKEKGKRLEREPDFYYRHENEIILFECKDFFMKGEYKLSYDFEKIIRGLSISGKDGTPDRLRKATIQLCKNVERCLKKEIPGDNDYELDNLKIMPVVVVHDSLYSAATLNYWVNNWFFEELQKLENEEWVDYSKIVPLTLIEIDDLIYFKDVIKNFSHLIYLIKLYQSHVGFRTNREILSSQRWVERASEPFSYFLKTYLEKKKIKDDEIPKHLESVFRDYGVIK